MPHAYRAFARNGGATAVPPHLITWSAHTWRLGALIAHCAWSIATSSASA